METNTIKFETPEEGIGLLTLNRPDRLNAMSLEMLDELYDLFGQLKYDDNIRVLIITGAGEGFCSGADLSGGLAQDPSLTRIANPGNFLHMVQKRYSGVILEQRRLPQPIIAAVNGVAAGGGMCVALAADVIYANPNARFVPSFANIGLSGGELGTTYFLPRLVGTTRAAEILLTGRTVEAQEADRIGLVCRVLSVDELLDTSMVTARLMLEKSKLGLQQTKEAININLTAPSLESAIEFENRNQAILAFGPDFAEAVNKFGKKRK